MLLIAGFSCATGFFVYFPLTNTDIWWHLAAGKEIVKQMAFLRQDPFSYTNPGASWINLHWLFQVGVYGLYDLFGLKSLVFLKIVLASAFCLALSLINRSNSGRLYTALVFTLLMYEARFLVLARPVLVTLCGLWCYHWLLERYSESGRPKPLLWLLPVQAVWTNCQGLFILGPVMAGLYCMEALYATWLQRLRPAASRRSVRPLHLAGLFGGVTLACLVNPYGVKGLFFPFKLFGRIDPSHANLYSRNVSENLPLFSLGGPDRRLLAASLVVLSVYLISLALNPKAFKLRHGLVFGAFFCLACMAKRNVLLYFFMMAPILGYALSQLSGSGLTRDNLAARLRRGIGLGLPVFALVLLLADFVQHNRIVSLYPAGSVSPFRVPVFAVRYLNEHAVPGNIFNSIRYGGYLIWKRHPDHKVYIDGRLIIRSPGFFSSYLNILDNPAQFEAVADHYGISHALLPIALFPRYLPLAAWLYRSDNWKLAFTDGASALFVKRSLPGHPSFDLKNNWDNDYIKGQIALQWPQNDYIRREALIYFGRFRAYLGIVSDK